MTRRIREFLDFKLGRAALILLRLLISVDLLLICAHVLALLNNPDVFLDSVWCLEQDGGVAEIGARLSDNPWGFPCDIHRRPLPWPLQPCC